MKAKMASFYGWDDEYLSQLDPKVFFDYWNAITVIEARDLLAQFTVGCYPNMDTTKRNEKHREVHRLAYPRTWVKQKSVQGNELRNVLAKFQG